MIALRSDCLKCHIQRKENREENLKKTKLTAIKLLTNYTQCAQWNIPFFFHPRNACNFTFEIV